MRKFKREITYMLLLFLIVQTLFISACTKPKETVVELSGAEELTEIEESEPAGAQEQAICIYVCGAVENPGVYELQPDARLYQAIEAAGGMLDMAAFSYLNQAELLADGQKVYVPTEEEMQARAELPEETAEAAGSAAAGLVNINTASKEELMILPGIGESKASNIVAYRENNGSFKKIEDIKNISGIGEATFEKLKALICI